MKSLRMGYWDLKNKTLRVVGFESQKVILLLQSLKQKHAQKNRIEQNRIE
jgi:hypothetical protein